LQAGWTKFKRVILVTGTPGVGKTAVSRLLASKLSAEHVDLGELVKKENLVVGVDEARETLVVDTPKVSKRVRNIIKESERDVIIDGHYAVDVVPAKHVHLVFVLRRDPDELKRLMEKRGFKEGKIQENLEAEILDVCLSEAVKACGPDKVCEIDTSGREIEDVVEEIISILQGNRKCRRGIVDWLGRLDREGRLLEFFK
jgi:adenylate kinase